MSRAPTVLLLGPPREALGLALEAVGLQPLWMPTLDQARASLSPRSLAALSLPGLNAADAAQLAAWQAEGLMAPVVLREERGRSPHIAGLSRIRPLSEAGDEALVRLLLRVARPPAEGRLSLRKGVVDLDGRQLLVAEGPPISLTAREAELLAYLAARPEELVSEAALLRDVWDAAAGVVSRAVHHTLSRLRAKVELDPAAPDHLRTEPGQGFRFVPGPRVEAPPPPATRPTLPPLPGERNIFVGRQAELTALRDRFAAGDRVLTLLGIGGMGKTRLALRFAEGAPRAAFADLSAATDRGAVEASVAAACGLSPGSGGLGPAIHALGPLLLVLDNAETAPQATAEALDRWLDAAPGLQALVTSRVALGLRGEVTLPLHPLDPAAAAALFVARAPGPVEAGAAVVDLVERLDHLPLAIELAAARAAVLSVETLAAHLNQRFRLLRRPGGTGRHDTLQAVIEGSWQQLPPAARRFGLWLSVCEGSFSPEAAEALVPPDCEDWAVDLLATLSAHALVQREEGGRLRMLATIRATAQGWLERSGEAPAAQAAHRRFFAARFAAPLSAARLSELGPERPNLLSALQSALAERTPEVPSLLGAAWELLRRQGPASLAVALAEAALAQAPAHPAPLWLICASARRMAGDTEGALQAAEQAAQSADPAVRTQAANLRGILHMIRSEPDAAEAAWADALALTPNGPTAARCALLNNLGGLAVQRGDLALAATRFSAACADAAALRDPRRLVLSLDNALLVAVYQGDFEAAARLEAEALKALPPEADAGLRLDQALAAATFALDRGDGPAAQARATEALALAQTLGDPRQEGWCRLTLAVLAQGEGREAEALREGATALSLAQSVQEPTLEGTTLGLLSLLSLLRGAPAEAAAQMAAAWSRLAQHPPHATVWLHLWGIEQQRIRGERQAAREAFAALPASVQAVARRAPTSPAGRLWARLGGD